VLDLEHRFLWFRNLDTSEGRSETAGKFDCRDDQLDRLCEKWRSVTHSDGGMEHPTYDIKIEGLLDWSRVA
jgi:hypothetical protein